MGAYRFVGRFAERAPVNTAAGFRDGRTGQTGYPISWQRVLALRSEPTFLKVAARSVLIEVSPAMITTDTIMRIKAYSIAVEPCSSRPRFPNTLK